MAEDYLIHKLANGIRLHFLKTEKFKTISLGLFIHGDLKPETAALNALLPSVLEKGCRAYPTYLTLQRELEGLYGAELSTDIIKSGERHIIAIGLEAAHDRFLGEGGDNFARSINIMGNVLGDPLLENGYFKESYVRQEKNQLVKDIKALVNDKAAYAMERCLAEMCSRENFGVYKLGRVEDYAELNPENLYEHYKKVLTQNPIDLYVIGDLDEEEIVEKASEAFSFYRGVNPEALNPAAIDFPVNGVRNIVDQLSVNQAKMVLGYRTYTPYDDPLHCPLLVYSGLLGGFPHSKLFMQVREEASLAYYIHTRLERHKGLMIIAAGINAGDYENTRRIIDLQLADMEEGRITDEELENTKSGLINQLLSRQDSPSQLISFHLDGVVGGRHYTFDQLIKGIEEVEREQISAVAKRLKLDTTYLLEPSKEEVS